MLCASAAPADDERRRLEELSGRAAGLESRMADAQRAIERDRRALAARFESAERRIAELRALLSQRAAQTAQCSADPEAPEPLRSPRARRSRQRRSVSSPALVQEAAAACGCALPPLPEIPADAERSKPTTPRTPRTAQAQAQAHPLAVSP
eukprot:m51a1_g6891 hypothetical protein (151) ;mRNA; r:6246-6698